MRQTVGLTLLAVSLISALGLLSAIECSPPNQIARLEKHPRSSNALHRPKVARRHFRRDVSENKENNEGTTDNQRPGNAERNLKAALYAREELPYEHVLASEADPSMVEEVLKAVLSGGDENLRYTKATIEQPVKIIQILTQIQRDIAWGMFGENYKNRRVNSLRSTVDQ